MIYSDEVANYQTCYVIFSLIFSLIASALITKDFCYPIDEMILLINLISKKLHTIVGFGIIQLALILCVFQHAHAQFNSQDKLTLWYQKPAANWEQESLPIGNGAMGASIMGGIDSEQVVFNEKTLWSGGPGAKGYSFGNAKGDLRKDLETVRMRIDSQTVVDPNWVSKTLGQEKIAFGDYQVFGTLNIVDDSPGKQITDYHRQLNIENALASVSYKKEDLAITRTYFASYPEKSIIIHITASAAKALSYRFFTSMPKERKASFTAKNGVLRVFGRLLDNQLYFESVAKIINIGGTKSDDANGTVQVRNADEILIILSAATNYMQQYPFYRGELPTILLKKRIDVASQYGYQKLLERHLADYQTLFNRVKLELGQANSDLPTDSLLKEYQTGIANTGQQRLLESLFFQYGRYLLIASSRDGSPPANLQGVWNNVVNPPWNSDYHHNINLQMNYWLAETTNLSEMANPLFDHINALVAPGKETARKLYHAPGWVTHLDMNIYGFTGVGDYPTSFWFPEAGAWLSQHLYVHYLFSNDKKFLRVRAYPTMKGAVEFWLSQLRRDPRDGKLVVTPSFSPENERFGYVAGASISQQLIHQLLVTTLKAAEILEADKSFQYTIITTLKELDSGLRIGRW